MICNSQDGAVRPFRYSIQCKKKVNVFTPKPLTPASVDVRATQCGALLVGHLKKFLPGPNSSCNDLCQILWEVAWLSFKF